MKKFLPIIAAIVLGFFAVIAVQRYISSIKQEYAEKSIAIAVARYAIEANTIITEDMISVLKVDKRGKTPDQVTLSEARSILNRAVKKSMLPNEPFQWSQIGEEVPKEMLSQKIEKGSRALTIGVAGTSAVMDMIHPGDQVDLIGTFDIPKVETRTVPLPDGKVGKVEVTIKEEASFVLLQNVTVLAVGQRYDKEATGGNLTVIVSPEEAIYLIFSTQHGQITCLLRNSEDVSDLDNIQVINYERMLDMAALEGLNQKRKQKIIEEIRGGVTSEELIDSDE